ncbi:GNAT family N-acetyltransferase [Cumulibacter manganitolerans]|uniref:GNAT family N-acetyltransferase n=1 Tax=Cumulibacter manganitolerans TaxID=1884992 RepID=UPI0012972F95|nr:GNAT family N-acetyltransferase [Cumulibacter manganitolerans]
MTSLRARIATPADLAAVQDIEAAADRVFAPVLDVAGWGTPPSGAERAETGGFVLVVGQPVVGFAHVVEVDGHHHLDQVAVHPSHMRQGIGTELVYAAVDMVASLGGGDLTLITFADVPWNAPFYETLGFETVDPAPARLEPLLARERAGGLHAAGRRVVMSRSITAGVVPRPAVSVIPVRDGERGLEVYVQHRVHTMDFAPGAVVFPGGRVDPIDAEHPPEVSAAVMSDLLDAWRDSTYVGNAEDRSLAVRTILATGLREMAEETGVDLRVEELLPWDDWTTPPGFPKRFQVHFMVTGLPSDDPRSPQNTTTEALASEWLPVREILERGRGGDLQLMTPTRVILQELEELGSADAVLAAHPQPTPVHLDRSGTRPRPSRKPG